ncbi:hypothetical protein [Flavobacterium sp.]
MKKYIHISILLYYLLGTFLLPMGDFATLQDLPKMYENCKAKEDKDMTLADFITDHLLNIDGIFDKHEQGDEQKPHKATGFTFNHSITQLCQEIEFFNIKKPKQIAAESILISKFEHANYSFDYCSLLLKPPIVS